MTHLSVIIPTLNEAATLPGLIDRLHAQTRRPEEIIVADAGSKDNTRELARKRGAIVVRGGLPGPGRNAGARIATGDLFLFLDADVLPRSSFIEKALSEFEPRNYAVATCLIEPLSDSQADLILAEVGNLFMQVTQYFSPHAPGFCIWARRDIHEAIGGFDERVIMAEDHDYVQRAAQQGEFGVLTGVSIPVSMRRLEKEGLTQLAFKYLWSEMHALAGKPIYSLPFEYEFGAFEPAEDKKEEEKKGLRLIDIGRLREELGKFENPLNFLSAADLKNLDEWIGADLINNVRTLFSLRLDTPDLDAIQRYLLRRLALIRRSQRPLREALAKFQTNPIKENIRLLDMDWLRSHLPKAGRLGKNGNESPEEQSVGE